MSAMQPFDQIANNQRGVPMTFPLRTMSPPLRPGQVEASYLKVLCDSLQDRIVPAEKLKNPVGNSFSMSSRAFMTSAMPGCSRIHFSVLIQGYPMSVAPSLTEGPTSSRVVQVFAQKPDALRMATSY